MRLHDAPANGKPHAHARGLGREQRLKNAIPDCFIDARAGIPNGNQHTVTLSVR